MDSVEFGNIPISNISNPNALIVVWCTNAKAHQEQLMNDIFPKWDVEYLTTWHWVKVKYTNFLRKLIEHCIVRYIKDYVNLLQVTKSGDPIVPFNSGNLKQPYETIIIGRRKPETPSEVHEDLKCSKVIISIPSSIHSHKPPLVEIFNQYLNSASSKKCEIFARYLIPGFTSIGNEVIKLQHTCLYVANENEDACAIANKCDSN